MVWAALLVPDMEENAQTQIANHTLVNIFDLNAFAALLWPTAARQMFAKWPGTTVQMDTRRTMLSKAGPAQNMVQGPHECKAETTHKYGPSLALPQLWPKAPGFKQAKALPQLWPKTPGFKQPPAICHARTIPWHFCQ